MRVAWIADPSPNTTGPTIYADAALGALAGRAEMVGLSSKEKSLQPERYDWVHFQDIKHASPSKMRWARASAPFVTLEFHDDYFLSPILRSPDGLLRWGMAQRRRRRYLALADQADRIIVHSHYMKSRIDGWLNCETLLIPYPKPNIPSAFPPQSDRQPLILFVGRDWYRKGAPTLASAFRRVNQRIPEARLAMVGHEYLHSRTHIQMISRGLAVEFYDALSNQEVMELMRQAAIVAIPSNQEAFGIVQLEAAGCGATICASKVGGLDEFIKDGANGRLLPPGDIEAWSIALIELLLDGDLRARLAQQALADLEAWPNAEPTAEAFLKIYENGV